ncbi:MAG: hypothetical protein U9Q67_02680 [Patescibacteria group bacterium]|nr:hypothetical protein [Patescibacteria group bacterium]
MNLKDLFKPKKKEKIHDSFEFEEATQSYRLKQYGYLYEGPTDSYLTLYKQLYDNVPVLDGAINAYTDLTCAGWEISSDDAKEAELITDELNLTNFDKILKTNMDSYFIYGFYGAEIVPSKKFDKIEKFQDIPSTQLRLKRNDYGDITEFVQQSVPRAISFNPAMVLYSANRESTSEPYGRSLFKSMPWITRIMLEMQDSMNKIYRRYGSPRFHVKYIPAIQLDQNTLEARLRIIKNKFKDIEIGQDFFTAGDVEIGMIGAGTGEQFKLTIEMSEIMQAVFSGLKIPAGVLGYNYGSTETHLKKQIEILLGRILSYQREQAHVINLKLMPLLATIYNLKGIPVLKFNKPIITDEAADLSVETLKINNVNTLIAAGLITPADGQQRLGLEVKEIKKPEGKKTTNGGNGDD